MPDYMPRRWPENRPPNYAPSWAQIRQEDNMHRQSSDLQTAIESMINLVMNRYSCTAARAQRLLAESMTRSTPLYALIDNIDYDIDWRGCRTCEQEAGS